MPPLTHFDAAGQAHMVDVGAKPETRRSATACGRIYMQAEAFALLQQGHSRKGDILGIARIAAIQGTKHTALLIPLCHPLSLSHVVVEFSLHEAEACAEVRVTAQTHGRTGVEMEALCGVNAALLTIYDMLKAVDKTMRIDAVRLLAKQGGRSGDFVAD